MHDTASENVTRPRGLRQVGAGIAGLAVIVVAAGLFSRASDSAGAARWSQAQAQPTVHLILPTPGGKVQDLTLPGTLAAWNTAHIYARVPGYVRAWYRDIGADVGTGAALGAIDTPELDQQINQARAALARARTEAVLAKSTAARWADLLTTASVSRQEADEKNAAALTRDAAVREAEADLGKLLAMKAYATVRAPFAGIVTARNADIGDLVGPGASNQQPMFGVADENRVRVYVNVPQQFADMMRTGALAKLQVPERPNEAYFARIVGTSGAINSQTGALQVQLVTDNPGRILHAGGYAQVRFSFPASGGLATVPASALILRGSGVKLATVKDGRIHLLPVTLGRDLGPSVEIAAGLPSGTAVVDNPPDSLAEGEAVHIQSKGG
ncbi:MAG: efflux RND transporter periplasmic adaptor subunit [Sphingomonadales bacterium]|nr:efflux RND transporter periplasmic adaptor subunit [Sphingomonadales bacterium]